MLNRRTLRIKAMQSLYSFYQCRQSDYHLAIEHIGDAFAPDLNSMEIQDPVLLKQSKEEAVALFKEKYLDNPITYPAETHADVKKAASEAIAFYRNQVKKDKEHLRRLMVQEAEKIYERYLWIMQLIVELAQEEWQEYQRKVNKGSNRLISTNFYNNKLVDMLREHEEFSKERAQLKISWNKDTETISGWYKDIIRPDEQFDLYRQTEEPSLEQDLDWVNYLVKKIFFKHETFVTFFEERFLNWAEDKSIIRSMVTKTLKAFATEEEDNDLAELSYNWEDDREFFDDLFVYTLEHDDDFEERISAKTKNWDIDRVASIDKVMLKMALAEMIHFSSIPVKVTINEYIEISKLYSTKKSKQFINGILDVLSEEMKAEGLIKKSGRGLIDNK